MPSIRMDTRATRPRPRSCSARGGVRVAIGASNRRHAPEIAQCFRSVFGLAPKAYVQRERVDEMRHALRGTLQQALEREIDASIDRMRAAYAPYRRFVFGEQGRLQSLAEAGDAWDLSIADLRLRLDQALSDWQAPRT
mgnify:CR=1 FL=1